MSEAERTSTRKMYVGLVAGWSQQEIIDHIMYWRERTDGLNAEVEANRTVKHLRQRILALTRKLNNTRRAAIEFMKGRAFDNLVQKKEQEALAIRSTTVPPQAL